MKRFSEPAEANQLRELEASLRLTGLHFEKEGKRYYPKGSVASHVLGYVGIDHNGQGGLEQKYDKLLTGQSGVRRVHFDALRRQYESSVVQAPVAGSSLFLTIDESIQTVAETSLASAIADTGAKAGSIVMMDPVKGDVLAMANWPTFDPNDRPRGSGDLAARQNYAISHLYEPGSTFKMVTVAAALEEGLTKPSEVIDCRRRICALTRRASATTSPLRRSPSPRSLRIRATSSIVNLACVSAPTGCMSTSAASASDRPRVLSCRAKSMVWFVPPRFGVTGRWPRSPSGRRDPGHSSSNGAGLFGRGQWRLPRKASHRRGHPPALGRGRADGGRRAHPRDWYGRRLQTARHDGADRAPALRAGPIRRAIGSPAKPGRPS
ncbi:MAG: penicillin-binding transpeptidase domain-containing protein [Bryobacterales bacterium]